jgi:hypothetical protein
MIVVTNYVTSYVLLNMHKHWLEMTKYKAVPVSNGVLKRILREVGWAVFHRTDEDGRNWLKAAMNEGARVMISYGLNPYK